MALYNTVPAEESTLLAPKKNNKIKGLVAVAAIAAFALGAVAATATQMTPAKEVVNLSKGGTCNCDGGAAPNYKDLRTCLDGCAGYATVKLGSGDFALGPPQYAVPSGMSIVGSGVANTVITAYGPVNEETNCLSMDKSKKIGFILGDNTNFQDFTYVSLDNNRLVMDASTTGLCGGAVFEAPGCTASDCGEGGHGNDYVLSADKTKSISNAQISNIFITGKNSKDDKSPCWWDDWGNDDCYSAPQSALFIPTLRSLTTTMATLRIPGITETRMITSSFSISGSGGRTAN
ncbi:unnamed protein product [Pelagomonas calceolata]|uniref:Uncharacterized protein n=1 Tax=Pelagomonas calceolata TaxID=35677 RepID=A0A7S4E266_9STRA|nr:unnamed protein product [Pelagomonas calceolata]